MSNNLDLDQARDFVGPDLGPNCLQKLSADDISRQRDKLAMINLTLIHFQCSMIPNVLRMNALGSLHLSKPWALSLLRYMCLFLFDSLRPSQQFFSYVGMGLPGLNQY